MNFKRILSLVLVLVLSLGIFAGCGNKGGDDNTPTGATLDQALSYLDTIYKSQNGVKDVKNYDVVAKVLLNGGADVFTITWTVDNANITIKESDEAGFYTVVLPASNAEEVNYKLTATVKNAAGETAVYTVNKILGKYQATVEGASELVEGQAYKLYTAQKYAQKHLFATSALDQGKYYVATEDYTAALTEGMDAASKSYFNEKVKITVNKTVSGAVIVCDQWHKDEQTGLFTNYIVMELSGEEYLKALYKELGQTASSTVDKELLEKLFIKHINNSAKK